MAMGQKNIIRHRVPQIRRGTEPKIKESYLPREGAHEPALCNVCESVYHHKRWYLKDDPIAVELQKDLLPIMVCPACRKTLDHFPGGVITLNGSFLADHKDQILHLIRNEERRAKEVNPLERVISIKDLGDSIEIHTTNEKFAQRVGKEIQRAFKGEVSYHWTHGDKFVRVEWHREGKAQE